MLSATKANEELERTRQNLEELRMKKKRCVYDLFMYILSITIFICVNSLRDDMAGFYSIFCLNDRMNTSE